MDSFFVLKSEDGNNLGATWAYAVPDYPLVTGETQKCPLCGKPISRQQWLEPHHVTLSKFKPDHWGDFLWTKDSELLVSRKFKDLYEQNGLTGIFKFSGPVDIVRVGNYKEGQFPFTPPEYFLAQVLWGGANQDDTASGLTYQHPEAIQCKFCRSGKAGRKQDRTIIEAGSWNGNDIFSARNSPSPYLVSDRFKQAVQSNQLTNAWFIPAENFGFDDTRWGKWFVTEVETSLADQADEEIVLVEGESA